MDATEAPESRKSRDPNRGAYGTKRSPARKPFRRTTIAETIEILSLNKKGVSTSEIARITGISVQTVHDRILANASTIETSLGVLQANAHQAATDWVGSFPSARKRGDHRPMRDALIAVGVVRPDPQAQGVTIIVGSTAPADQLPMLLQLPVVEAKVADNDTITAFPAHTFAHPTLEP